MSEIVAVPSPSAAIPGTDGDALSALDLSTSAVAALIEEAELTPKPALVDRRGNGAHHDLDLERLRLSAGALRDGFAAIARAAAGEEPSLRLREQLGRIGREMERRMLAATDGGNAHRGAIWALGLLVAAAAQRRSERHPASIAATAAALARLPDRFAPRPLGWDDEKLRLPLVSIRPGIVARSGGEIPVPPYEGGIQGGFDGPAAWHAQASPRPPLPPLRKGGNLSFSPRLGEDHGDLGATQQAFRRCGGRSGQDQLCSMPPLSNGERARLRFGATGARGEAQAGFPHAILVGLPTLRAARPRGTRRLCATRYAHGHHGQPR